MDDELRLLVERCLELEVESVVRIDHGWDSAVLEVNGEWIVRVPRRPEVAAWMRKEAALLPLLAPALPVPVPEFAAVADADGSFFVAYRKLEGEPLTAGLRAGDEASLAWGAGRFLAALHAFPAAAKAGIDSTVSEWLADQEGIALRSEQVLRLLDAPEQRRARTMFDRHLSLPPDFELVLLHADLGPEHILCRGGSVSGVIDWSDARIGDPALDFAWLLHGAGEAFGHAVLRSYAEHGGRMDDELQSRALYFHRLGPWHEVLHGLQTDRPELVASGLAGVRKRLP